MAETPSPDPDGLTAGQARLEGKIDLVSDVIHKVVVVAHDGPQTHRYVVSFPEHPARKDDPHYKDFNAFHRKYHDTAQCAIGLHRGDFSECDLEHPMELHHAHIEFALQNGVDLAWLEKDYPGISDPDKVGEWVESGANFVWYCQFHHRGRGGAHTASASDFEAEKYVKGLIHP